MATPYYISPDRYSLEKLENSLRNRDLVPSRVALKEDLHKTFCILHDAGLSSLGELQKALSTKHKIQGFAESTGLSEGYLTLLRREANSYFPKPVKLSRYEGVPEDLTSLLAEQGIKTSKDLFEALAKPEIQDLVRKQPQMAEGMTRLCSLVDLSRLYGVGPAFAGILLDAGIDSVRTLIHHNGEEIRVLYEQRTGKKADFTSRDIDFTLEIARELQLVHDESS